jgi:hypothetical protein
VGVHGAEGLEEGGEVEGVDGVGFSRGWAAAFPPRGVGFFVFDMLAGRGVVAFLLKERGDAEGAGLNGGG